MTFVGTDEPAKEAVSHNNRDASSSESINSKTLLLINFWTVSLKTSYIKPENLITAALKFGNTTKILFINLTCQDIIMYQWCATR